ncbi:hypothetical protein K2173_022921 [Erythroxylum novogranatense]|uniref:RING-type domain-containing protein n=1 Tax=Erythroxylum novogranatense TaxID=1862640 RepID=A0AAV8T7M9_9ROSI|nr:hypothetical protein K2173_022921 [Erythroxylum novogranatense]
MDNEERKQNMDDREREKQATRRAPFPLLDQVHSDFAMAMAMQEQERVFTSLPSIESEIEEDGETETSSQNYDNDYEFFEGLEFEGDVEYTESQDSSSDQDMEEDEVDPDELSYEELVALGEFVGEEKRGLSLTQISKCLLACKYQCTGSKTGTDRCVICQVEYEEGEPLANLPCDHPYHFECISNWLQIKKLCPICNNEVTAPKIAS